MSGTTDLEAILSNLLGNQQPPSIPTDPYVLTSKLNTELAKKADESDVLGFAQDTLAGLNNKIDVNGDISTNIVKIKNTVKSVPLADLLADSVTPYMYDGLPGSGNDATNAIQQALNSGKNVRLANKFWYVSSPLKMLNSNQYILAESEQCGILSTTANGNIIEIGDGSNHIINAGILGPLRLWTTVKKTAGTFAIKTVFSDRCTIEARIGPLEFQVNDGNLLANGIGLDTASYTHVSGGVSGFFGTGVSLWSATNALAEVTIEGIHNGGFSNGTATAWGNIGVHIGGGCGGVNLRTGGAQNCNYGVVISTELASGTPNRELFIDPGYAPDSNTVRNIQIRSNSVYDMKGIGIDCGGCGIGPAGYTPPSDVNDGNNSTYPTYGVGLEIQNPQISHATFDFSHATIHSCQRDGVLHWNGNLILNGAKIFKNGHAALGGSGYRAKYTMTDGLTAIGCNADRNGLTTDFSAATKGAGYVFEAGSDNFQVIGGSARFAPQGSVQAFSGFGTTKVFKDVLGFVTRVVGRFAVAANSSQVTVPTGLSLPPTKFIAFPDNTLVSGYQPITRWVNNSTNGANIDVYVAATTTALQAYTYIAEY